MANAGKIDERNTMGKHIQDYSRETSDDYIIHYFINQ
jgi:hypothetical protein